MLANVAQNELEARTAGLLHALLHAVANVGLHESNDELAKHHVGEEILGRMIFRKEKNEPIDDLMDGPIIGKVKVVAGEEPLPAIEPLLMLIERVTDFLYKVLGKGKGQTFGRALMAGLWKVDAHQFVCWQYHTLTWKKIETGLIPQMHYLLAHDHTGQRGLGKAQLHPIGLLMCLK